MHGGSRTQLGHPALRSRARAPPDTAGLRRDAVTARGTSGGVRRRRESMRITFVNQYHRHGGAERCLHDLYNGARARGHDVTVVVGKSTDPAAEAAAGIAVLSPGRLEWLSQRGAH